MQLYYKSVFSRLICFCFEAWELSRRLRVSSSACIDIEFREKMLVAHGLILVKYCLGIWPLRKFVGSWSYLIVTQCCFQQVPSTMHPSAKPSGASPGYLGTSTTGGVAASIRQDQHMHGAWNDDGFSVEAPTTVLPLSEACFDFNPMSQLKCHEALRCASFVCLVCQKLG